MLRLLRIAFILLGAFILLWLSTENRDVRLTLSLGVVFCLLVGLRAAIRMGVSRISPLALAGIGGLIGLFTPLLAVILMILKIGLHSHQTPDFTLFQVIEVLARAPFFMLGGFLAGLGVGWFWRIRGSP